MAQRCRSITDAATSCGRWRKSFTDRPNRRRIDVFLNEALITELSEEFKRISYYHELPKYLEQIGAEPSRKKTPKIDEFLEAALLETICLIFRRDLKIAREALSFLDETWINIEDAADLALLFDNLNS